jgi:hypothetical protein
MQTRSVVYNCCYGSFGLSEKALKLLSEKKGQPVTDCWLLSRHDPDLVAVVKELGGPDSSDDFSDLRIVEVTGRYRIKEYDGLERVTEEKDNQGWL